MPAHACIPHIAVSHSAQAALLTLGHAHGPHVVVLAATCAQVSIARVVPQADYVPSQDEVRVGTVAHCAVYARPSAFETCPHEGLVLDLQPAAGALVFVTRPESRAERQQRIFSQCVGRS